MDILTPGRVDGWQPDPKEQHDGKNALRRHLGMASVTTSQSNGGPLDVIPSAVGLELFETIRNGFKYDRDEVYDKARLQSEQEVISFNDEYPVPCDPLASMGVAPE